MSLPKAKGSPISFRIPLTPILTKGCMVHITGSDYILNTALQLSVYVRQIPVFEYVWSPDGPRSEWVSCADWKEEVGMRKSVPGHC